MGAKEANQKTIGARWIATADGPLLNHAAFRVVDGVIVEFIGNGQAHADQDLGDVLITPKWINAHTHLEFSHLSEPLGSPGMSITDWIPLVISDRMEHLSSTIDSVGKGLEEINVTGTIGLGEIATQPWFKEDLNNSSHHSIFLTAFVERLGNQPEQNSSKLEEARQWLDFEFGGNWRGGLSPHAPYSTNFELFTELMNYAVQSSLPVAMHLAETKEERQFLTDGTGPFRKLLESLNAAPVSPHTNSISDFIHDLARAKRAMIIHGNYLTEQELDLVAKHDSLHIVFCPRTHRFFGHDPYPLEAILMRQINLAVGTDSRASNPDLNLLGELVQIATRFPTLSPTTILEMGTINGAKALGIVKSVGSLAVGKQAQFLTFPMATNCEDPLESLFRE